jgi:hypothetical protein
MTQTTRKRLVFWLRSVGRPLALYLLTGLYYGMALKSGVADPEAKTLIYVAALLVLVL